MYQYELTISIFSNDELLEKDIYDIKPLEKFSHSIKRYNKVDYNAIKISDIIIWDLELEELINIKKECNENTKIILCSTKYIEEFDSVDGILLKPFNHNFIKYYLKQILNNIKLERDLHYTNTCLDTAINSTPNMFWVKSLDGIHTLVNDAFCDVVDKEKDNVIGYDHYHIWNVSKDDPNSGADTCQKTEDEVIEARQTKRFNECVKSPNGIRQLIVYKSPIFDINAKVIGTVGIGHDITDLRNMGEEIEILLNSVPYAVLIRDENGIIKTINKHFEKYFRVLKENIINLSYDSWAQNTFIPERSINQEGYTEGTTYPIGGKIKKVELRFDDITDIFNNITGQICLFRDVTLVRKLEKENYEKTIKDPMTKVYNRQYLNKFIYDQQEKITLNLFSIDLDHFKQVNDTYGHAIGDGAIILTANILRESFSNDIVIRMGGDEFLVIKTGEYKKEELEKDAEKLLKNFKNKFEKSSAFSILTASIGIATGVLENNNFETIYKNSDAALYQAKENGRSCYCLYEEKKKFK